MPADVKALLARWDRLDADRRTNWDADFLELANYLLPTRAMAINLTIPGVRITRQLFDSEGITAPTLLASSLHGNLSNPSTKWFTFYVTPEELNEDNAVQDWLEAVARRVTRVLDSSNFHYEIGETYLEGPVFGTAAIIEEEETAATPGLPPRPLFTALPIGTYGISENEKGRVDVLFYQSVMTVRACLREWGEANHADLQEKVTEKPDDLVTLLHAIYPRNDRDERYGRRDRRNKPFASCWVDVERKHIIREGGYEEFPGAVWRWRKQPGETYGRGQGHLALPDIKTLNREVELLLQGLALDIAPPLFELDRTVVGDLLWEPLARNVVRDKQGVWTLPSGVRYDVAKMSFDRLETKIRKIFFVDQIQALPPSTQGPSYMTAFEVAKRVEQEFKLLGPAYGRVTGELHAPIIERTARMLVRAGGLPPPPPGLRMPGVEMHIKYLGPMARAQEAETLTGIAQKNLWVQTVLQMNPNDQSVLDNFDFDQEALVVARGYGVPASVTRGKDAVEQIRQQRIQAQAAQQQKMDLMAVAEGAGKAAPMVQALHAGAAEEIPA